MSFIATEGTRLVDTTEFSLPRNAAFLSGTHINSTNTVQVELHVPTTLLAGEEFLLLVYDTINLLPRVVHRQVITATHAHAGMPVMVPPMVLGPNWDVTIKRLTVTPDRDMYWKLHVGTAASVADIQSGLATAAALATVQADTDNLQTRIPAALVGGRIPAIAEVIAADAVNASVLAADAVAEIAGAVGGGGVDLTPVLTAIATVQADTDNIQARLPAALEGGHLIVRVKSIDADVITSILQGLLGGSLTLEDALLDLHAVLADDAAGLGTNTQNFGAGRVIHAMSGGGAVRTRQ